MAGGQRRCLPAVLHYLQSPDRLDEKDRFPVRCERRALSCKRPEAFALVSEQHEWETL